MVDSRDVAEMIGKRHDHLLRDINGYVEILEKSTAPKIGLSEFFISSAYQDSIGRNLPCYLLTKKGCDMVANKMTRLNPLVSLCNYPNVKVYCFNRLGHESMVAIKAINITMGCDG